MRLEVTERGSKKYYDEFLYLAINYKKISNNSYKKIRGLSLSAYLYSFISIVFVATFLVLYLLNKDNLYMGIMIFFIVLFIMSILYLMLIYRKIRISGNIKGTNILEITDSYVKIEAQNTKIEYKWDEIKNIKIGKYTINFIPKDNTKPFITTNMIYIDQVMDTLKKYSKEDLIIK